ncbi:MAG TPA: DciA family protein [Veillonellaceae bacterium]|nr:DciA family protein [Veillonellaceae bacterium]
MEEDKKPEGKRYRTMESIAGVFTESDVRQKLFGNKGFQFYLFQKRWKKIVGSLMAEESYITGCKGPLLFVRVTNSAFLQQLFMMKADILKELSKDEIGRYFTDIKFLAGSPQKPYKPFTTLDPVNSAIEKEQKRYSQSLSEGEEAWIQNWVRSHVKKEAVRAPFAEMMEEVLKIRKGELADGYHPCSICGSLCPPDAPICPACRRKLDKTKKNKVILILKENPHYTYQQVRAILPCEYSLYEEARDILIHRAKEKIFRKEAADEEKRKLLSLLLHRPLSAITSKEAEDMLKHMPQKKWD